MDDTKHGGLREQILAMAAGRRDGIDLDSPERWVLEEVTDPVAFFRRLNTLIPGDSILYFEGCKIAPEMVQLYEKNRASNAVCVVRDTILPVPDCFHVAMTPQFIEDLVKALNFHTLEKCFYHVKAYRHGQLLFAFHDAFDGSPLLVTDRIPKETIRAFASSLAVSYRREPNVNKRDPKQLLQILSVLENPHKLRVNWPWWKKALRFWKK